MSHSETEFWFEPYKVDVPVGERGTARIERFNVTELEARFSSLVSAQTGVAHAPLIPGTYTRLRVDDQLWMTDEPAEVETHMAVIGRMGPGNSVLINGLGLGVVLQAAIRHGAARVDVVEINEDVIELVSNHYNSMAENKGVALTIIKANAYEYAFPRGKRWDVVWHDIWPTIEASNLQGMSRLHRRYGRRSGWQGSWARSDCLAARAQGGGDGLRGRISTIDLYDKAAKWLREPRVLAEQHAEVTRRLTEQMRRATRG